MVFYIGSAYGQATACPDSITIEIRTNFYPEETSWILYDEFTKTPVASIDPGELTLPYQTYMWQICVDTPGCFSLWILDEGNDGMNDFIFPGAFHIYHQGQLIGSGGDFFGGDVVNNIGDCPTICQEADLSINVATDKNGIETTWELFNQNTGALVASAGPYAGDSFFTEHVCIDTSECYYFVISDSSVSVGQGFYSLTFQDIPLGNGSLNLNTGRIVNIGEHCDSIFCTIQEILINPGWNTISSYIQPIEPAIVDIFSHISSKIFLVKNAKGEAYFPSLGINLIGDWQVTQGYKVKASGSAILSMGCTKVDPLNIPVILTHGWNIISYLRTDAMDVTIALSNISSNVLLLKNVNGSTYIPSLGINTIGDMEPGQGYNIKMAIVDTLYYPGN